MPFSMAARAAMRADTRLPPTGWLAAAALAARAARQPFERRGVVMSGQAGGAAETERQREIILNAPTVNSALVNRHSRDSKT